MDEAKVNKLMKGKKIKDVSISYSNDLIIKFEEGGMALLHQNMFREWEVKVVEFPK